MYRGTNGTAVGGFVVGLTSSTVVAVVQPAFTGVARGGNGYRGTMYGTIDACVCMGVKHALAYTRMLLFAYACQHTGAVE